MTYLFKNNFFQDYVKLRGWAIYLQIWILEKGQWGESEISLLFVVLHIMQVLFCCILFSDDQR